MKRFTRCICLILVFSMMMIIPVSATNALPRESAYFLRHSCYLWDVSSSGFQVWFDVRAMRTMDELGASIITVQKSEDAVNWTSVQTYRKADYPQMTIKTGTTGHAGYVTFSNVESDMYYRAYVQYYASNSGGTGTLSSYTSYVYIP